MEIILVLFAIVMIFVGFGFLFSPPKKHKSFGYKDQQRAMRAFDRSEQIDMGVPQRHGRKKKK